MFEVQGYTAGAFSYALCRNKGWTGRRRERANRVVDLCNDWSCQQSPTLIAAALSARDFNSHGTRRRMNSRRHAVRALKQCEDRVFGSMGFLTSLLFGAIIRVIVSYYIQWYINNYFNTSRAQGAFRSSGGAQ